jgi:hypothetical protein
MKAARVITLAFGLTALSLHSPALAEPSRSLKKQGPYWEFWSRQNGQHSDDVIRTKELPKKVYLTELKTEKRTKKDEQYHKLETLIGFPLATLIKSYKPKFQDDTVILHFANGMAVPLPLEDEMLDKLDAFVALKICPAKGACSADFPAVSRDDVYAVVTDPLPLKFAWNKIVVSSPWHPDVPASRSQVFSPWRHVDSLTGLEFVNGGKYKNQFMLGASAGEKVFFERCQFCHGVRHVGAAFGWDVVTPLPLYKKRTPETLLNHVKYPKIQAREMGISMPTQADVTAEEMRAVWTWMELAAKHKLKAY